MRFDDDSALLGQPPPSQNGQEKGHLAILETIGVGLAWIDYQNDGHLDLFTAGGGNYSSGPAVVGRPALLLRGDGEGFSQCGQAARLKHDGPYSHAAVRGDFDNDGFSDLLVTGYGALQLFHNMGDGTFKEVAAEVGIVSHRWATGAAWGDIDSDGNLDLYVTNYVDWSFAQHPKCFLEHQTVCSPMKFNAVPDVLFMSNGLGGFQANRLDGHAAGKGLAAMAADVDLDGDVDVYVANDTTPNLLLRNEGARGLVEVGLESGVAFGEAASSDGSMGLDAGDFNRDGLIDLWVTNYEGQSFALYQGTSSNTFTHASATTRVTAVGGLNVGFGTAFADFDADGDEDIICTNGHVTDASPNAPLAQRPLLFKNVEAKLIDVAGEAGNYMADSHVGRGLAVADYSGDGLPDVAITHLNGPLTLLRNSSTQSGNWLAVRLVGRTSNRDGVGATISLSIGEVTQLRLAKSGSSYLSSHEARLFFGLGDEQTATLQVRWPSGSYSELSDVACNQTVTIVESGPN